MCKCCKQSLLVYGTVENNVLNDHRFLTKVPWLSCKRILQRFPLLGIPTHNFSWNKRNAYQIFNNQRQKVGVWFMLLPNITTAYEQGKSEAT